MRHKDPAFKPCLKVSLSDFRRANVQSVAHHVKDSGVLRPEMRDCLLCYRQKGLGFAKLQALRLLVSCLAYGDL
jgi:hypothetical protein